MPDSATKRIKLAVIELLKAIDGTNGYNTDAGNRVYPHRFVDQQELPVICVFRTGTVIQYENNPAGMMVDHVDEFTITGLVAIPSTADADNDVSEDLIADILRAIESPENDLLATGQTQSNGKPSIFLTRPIQVSEINTNPPEAGAEFEQVTITIKCAHKHKIGDPNYVYSENN